MKKYLTLREAAELFGIPKWKLERAVREGLIPATSLATNRKLVRPQDVEAVLAANMTGGSHA